MIDGVINEIKGYHTDEVDIKIQATIDNGFKIKVLYLKDVKPMIEYCKDKFSVERLEEIYDDYKPKFTYKCDCCGNEFHRNRKIKTSTKFCSRVCSGKHSAEQNCKRQFAKE